jgi:competence ComEA-like helix-hairpin-helix protein
MLAHGIASAAKAGAGAARRLAIWGAYAALVAFLTSSWITARPASAEVPPGVALGEPAPREGATAPKPPLASAPPSDVDDTDTEALERSFGPPRPERTGAESGHATQPEARTDDTARGGLQGRLNLNAATKEELMLLPGIGDAISERIVAWREARGRFHRVSDLRRVRGIGPKTLENLRPYLTVIGPTTLRVKP